MPIHDWTRVDANVFHDFHQTWSISIRNALNATLPGLGQNPPSSDGKTDVTSEIFLPFTPAFRGGVHTAAGNFDGDFSHPMSLVTAAGAGAGPHVIVWDLNPDGTVGGVPESRSWKPSPPGLTSAVTARPVG